ncbi:Tripartite tricarboxylate transporter TctB family protein [Salipiger thiooxidans]|uniref:Tripartite tricarboxylate transporter TctB family protein n=1 Tax=Salipiger thiooxidans TaxID=282683 RepID=A0A1G7N2T6_9RHOB|nr:tripartite tricarboxylate transporter TctB family protein [Salipiger thiooxidans]SDF67669.1 Tripartite tricarboxylate transporter TctB family protein [Salipiger thiooxidans]
MTETGLPDRGAQGRLDLLIGLIAVVGAIVTVLWIIPAQIEPTSAAGQLSPRFFPTLSVIVIALFGLALMVKNRGFALSRLPHPGPALLLETLAWAVWATATMLLLAYAGFIAAGAISCFSGMVLAGQRRRLILCAGASLLLPLAIQQLAWHAFYIQLP